MCNVGGFGIDGCTSSLIGASLADKNKLYFLITGDLAFFYDLNVIGNRHIGPNVRILLVNTGNGAEFLHFQSPVYEVGVKPYIAAEGHFGNKSKTFVKEMAFSLGFDYFSANDKSSFNLIKEQFVSEKLGTKPMIFEVFTNADSQSKAWEELSNLADSSTEDIVRSVLKDLKRTPFANFIKKRIIG